MSMKIKNKIIFALIVSLFLSSCVSPTSSGAGDNSAYGAFKEGFSDQDKRAIYVLGPPIGTGWNGQIGRFASERVKEINKSEDYFAIYLEVATMSYILDYVSKEINSNKEKIGGFVLAPGDLDFDPIYHKLYAMNIPYAIYNDRSDSPNKRHAMVNILENDEQCGAAAAYWMTLRGLSVNTTFAVIYNQDDPKSLAAIPWSRTNVDRLFTKFSGNTRSSFDGANRYASTHMHTFGNSAAKYSGQILIFSTSDDFSLGFMYGLKKYPHNPDAAAIFDNCYFGIASIGGMQEYIDNINSIKKPLVDLTSRVDDLMTVYSSPNNVNYAIDYLILQLQKYKEETGEDVTSDALENYDGNDKKYGTAIVDTANYDLFIGYDGGYPKWMVE